MTDEPLTRKCFHCGLPVPQNSDISVEYQGEDRPMCCYGCQAVSQSIIDSGMDDFYRYRTSNPERPGEIVPDFLQKLKAYDSESVQKKFVSQTSDDDVLEVSLILEGITCAACIWLNEKNLNALDGVISADINYSNHRARVRWDNSRIQLSEILESISRIGYLAHPYDPEQHQHILEKERKQQIRRLGISGLFGMQVMIFAVALYTGDWWGIDEDFRTVFQWSSLVLTLPILIFASSAFFRSAYRDLINRRIGMDVPISLGIAIAFIASTINTIDGAGEIYFDSVAMFTFFLLSARFFEAGARKQTAEATEALLNLKPATATRLIDYDDSMISHTDSEHIKHNAAIENITVSELHPGDHLLVKPGETIPADGIICDGISGIDESMVTGESLPVTRDTGQQVIGGSTNTENPLIIKVTETGENSVLSSLQQLLEDAQHNKPAIARLADRIATWFVSILLSVAAAVAVYWYNTDASAWLEITIATLVVSCPCALSLATPTAITAASGQLAKIGLLPKRAHALETLAHATDFVFDKTGTLTEGNIKLERVILDANLDTDIDTDTDIDADLDEAEVRRIAATLESRSEHPIAKALTRGYEDAFAQISDLQHTTGQGIQGKIEGTLWYIGNNDFIHDKTGLRASGNTGNQSQVYLADQDRLVATFILSDQTRYDAESLVKQLHTEKRKTHLMSGDNAAHADDVSSQLGIQHCLAGLSPADKLAQVKQLQQQGAIVVMTGDGVNDAPVLAGADLSIAMGKGTQLAAAAADMILTNNQVSHIYDGYLIARKTLRIIKQNLSWSLLYNISAIPAAAMGYVEPWLAAIGMSASSLVVVLNAMRLTRMKGSR